MSQSQREFEIENNLNSQANQQQEQISDNSSDSEQKKTNKKKKNKKSNLSSFKEILKIYEIYLKVLLGRELESEDQKIFNGYFNPSEKVSTSNQQKKKKKKKNKKEQEEEVEPIKKIEDHLDYMSELDFHPGDTIIKLPNPDYENVEEYDVISPLDMIELCIAAFSNAGEGTEFEIIDNDLTIKAFEEAYYALEEFKEDFSSQNVSEVVIQSPKKKDNEENDESELEESSSQNEKSNKLIHETNQNQQLILDGQPPPCKFIALLIVYFRNNKRI